MTTRSPALSLENALYGLIFLAALGLRLLNLGAHPLNDGEAHEALAVLAQLRGHADPTLVPSSPAYFFITYFSFLIFGASEAAARLGPALAGSVLVLVPSLFRDLLGRPAALAASGMLAVSASLLAASRSADGTLLVLLALAIVVGALWRFLQGGRTAWLLAAGAALGFGVAGGSSFVLGLLSLSGAGLILRWTLPRVAAGLRPAAARLWQERRPFFAAVGLSAVVVSTVALVYLPGLGALLDAWMGGLAGFVPAQTGRLPFELILFLVVDEPLVVILGAIGAARAFRTGHLLGQALSWFALVALALLLVYGNRQVIDVAWVAAPLALLAGYALFELLQAVWAPSELPLALVQAGVTAALLGFALLNLAALAETARTGSFAAYQLQIFGQTLRVPSLAQLGIAALAVALAFVIGYLVALGWSERAAQLGLVTALSGLLFAMTLAAGWGVTQRQPGSPAELWWAEPASPEVSLLVATLENVSNYSGAHPRDIDVTVQASETGLLAWALRDFPHASFVDRLDPVVTSPVVIAPLADQENPTLGSTYVGQDFDLRSRWTPDQTGPEWIVWLAYRQARTIVTEPVVLWVRQDLAQLQSTGN
ncbi:MAG: glycosyltransferase family 39 protein [Anaerolineales bacterium]|nr:glycosyltransferase family 39 protein [Anaerolineales bacterium]